MVIVNISLFAYFGNKDNEIEIIKDNIPDLNNIDTIIEPYCGSFSLTRYLINIYPNKKYICNDIDKMLIDVYKALQDDTKCKQIIDFLNSFEIKDKAHYDAYKKENTLESYLFTHIIYRIRHGIYHPKKNKLNERDINKIIYFNKHYKNITFICGDAEDIIKNNIADDKILIFMDPPFLLTGCFYSFPTKNIEYFFNILMKMNELKSKILAVCGDNFLLIPFYEKYNIKIKFKTTIYYRGNKSQEHENIYISNY